MLNKMINNKLIRYFYAILFNINLYALVLLIRYGFNYFRRYIGLSNKLYYYLNDKSFIQSKKVLDIFNVFEIPEIKLIPTKSEGLETPIEELAYLALITKICRPKIIFEIGTYKGRTALNFALNSDEDTVIYTLDLPRNGIDISTLGKADKAIALSSNPGLEYKRYECSKKIKQLYGNSLSFDFSEFYNKVDLMFIDGGHSFECASKDTENALKMVR